MDGTVTADEVAAMPSCPAHVYLAALVGVTWAAYILLSRWQGVDVPEVVWGAGPAGIVMVLASGAGGSSGRHRRGDE